MENERIAQYNSLSILLITIGLVIVNTLIFNYMGRFLAQQIWDVDVTYLVKGNMEFNRPHSSALRFTQFLSQGGGFILSVIIVIQLMKRKFIEFTGLNKQPLWKWFGISLLFFFCMLPSLEWLVEWNRGWSLPAELEEQMRLFHENNMKIYDIMLHYNTGIDLWINLVVVAVMPAISEELLFRGLILRIFRSMFGNIHAAIWMTAIVFAGIHLQAYNIVPMIMMAAIFGYVYYFTGSLWVPILLHFLNNASYILMKRYDVASDSAAIEPIYVLAFLAAGILLFAFLHKRSPKPNQLTLE